MPISLFAPVITPRRKLFTGLCSIGIQTTGTRFLEWRLWPVRRGRLHEAQRYYHRLLNLNPRDSVAMAALFNLQRTTPGEISESQIKLLLDREPNAPHLHFSLGNLYARQARWAEAEQSYFQTYGHDSQNPDYVFNLAVSLDQLGQTETALNYYRKALALADRQPVNLNTSAILARIRSLSQFVSTR